MEVPWWASLGMIASTLLSHAGVLYLGPRLPLKPSPLLPELPACADFVCSSRAWPLISPSDGGAYMADEDLWLLPRVVPGYVLVAIPFFLLQIAIELGIQALAKGDTVYFLTENDRNDSKITL
jgi:hypothetical protein